MRMVSPKSASPMAIAAVLIWSAPAAAQVAPAAAQVAPAPVSPTLTPPVPGEEMAPLPDLGVDWPDLALPAGETTAAAGTVADQTRRYRVELDGIDDLDSAFRTRFNQLSALVTNEGKPANAAQIDRRAHDDETLVRQLLRAAGYYDGTVTTEVASNPDRVTVRILIDAGPAYTYSAVTLPGLEAAGAPAADLARDFRIKPGDAVDADATLGAISAFTADLGARGFPFAKVADPDITVDHETIKAVLALGVDPGPLARIGRLIASGPRPLFDSKHLGEIARFHSGQTYDASRIDDLRRALIQTGLVSSVAITPVRTDEPGVVDIDVRIDRAPPRTIAGELGYGTGVGARAELSWTHRNLIQPEGAVTFRGVAGTREQSLGATLRMSNFGARDRVLTAQAVAAHRNLDAYDAKTLTIGAGIERQTNIIFQKKWTWSLGAELLASDERDTIEDTGESRRRTFLVAALPSGLAYDGSDDLLNPTRGYRLSGRISPEASLQNGVNVYAKLQLDGSYYQPFVDGKYVLAGRFRFGSIQGASRDSIAPSRRFYAGGGGSVRGFGYQKIGPIDVNGDPIGGRALSEFSIEARVRFGAFGVVPFLDAGNLYTGTLPKLSGLRYGTGLGVRYYSSFGPIRIDVGTPIARRPGEARVAVYVSLGQAF